MIGIVGILAVISIAAFSGTSKGANLTAAEKIVVGQLNLARQTAITQNRPVEVRFYKIREQGGDAEDYRALRLWMLDDSGNLQVLEKAVTLPQRVIFSEQSQHLTLQSPSASAPRFGGDEVPGYGDPDYVAVQFRPNGEARDPNATTSTNLTLVLVGKGDQLEGANNLPKNWAAIDINPLTGVTRALRPN